MQASRKCTFAPLAGAKAPDPHAACGRKVSSKTERNGTRRGGGCLERLGNSIAQAVLLDSAKALREADCPRWSLSQSAKASIKLFVRSPAIAEESPPARLSRSARVPIRIRKRSYSGRLRRKYLSRSDSAPICVSLLPPQEKADSRQRPLTTVGSLRFVAQIIRCPLFYPDRIAPQKIIHRSFRHPGRARDLRFRDALQQLGRRNPSA